MVDLLHLQLYNTYNMVRMLWLFYIFKADSRSAGHFYGKKCRTKKLGLELQIQQNNQDLIGFAFLWFFAINEQTSYFKNVG